MKKLKHNGVPAPSEMNGALTRVNAAIHSLNSFASEMETFLYKYVEGMIKEQDPETGVLSIKLRHPNDSNTPPHAQHLAGKVAEDLRGALDYIAFEFSKRNTPDNTNLRDVQFVIADTEDAFKRESNRRLKFLTTDEKSFVEQCQPYHQGHEVVSLIRDMTNQSKHRNLLEVRDNSGLQIFIENITNKDNYPGYWMYPQDMD